MRKCSVHNTGSLLVGENTHDECERNQVTHTYILQNKIQHAAHLNGYGYHICIWFCIRMLAKPLCYRSESRKEKIPRREPETFITSRHVEAIGRSCTKFASSLGSVVLFVQKWLAHNKCFAGIIRSICR